MVFHQKTLGRYKWDNISTFRVDIQKYLKSIVRIQKPKHNINDGRAENLSRSENSGYNYSPIR